MKASRRVAQHGAPVRACPLPHPITLLVCALLLGCVDSTPGEQRIVYRLVDPELRAGGVTRAIPQVGGCIIDAYERRAV